MNAMWGAGQMMFNKILVLTASPNPSRGEALESFKITDYESLAKDVFKNLNPSTDIYFSQGPMDVLDHSCSKMGFGGKMCIDGTAKFGKTGQWGAGNQVERIAGFRDRTHIIEQSPDVNHTIRFDHRLYGSVADPKIVPNDAGGLCLRRRSKDQQSQMEQNTKRECIAQLKAPPDKNIRPRNSRPVMN